MSDKNDWIEVRDPYTGKLLFRLEKKRLLLEVKRGKVTTTVALRYYEEEEQNEKDCTA